MKKKCNKCDFEKDYEEFTSQKKGSGGRHGTCKECCRDIQRAKRAGTYTSCKPGENGRYTIGDVVEGLGGKLTYLGDTGRRNESTGNIIGKWKCYCGNTWETMNRNITKSDSVSCGCYKIACYQEKAEKSKRLNPQFDYLYHLHSSIKCRCYNKDFSSYQTYGGRGITFYTPWLEDVSKFAEELVAKIGHRPSCEHQLDRIDNDGNYEPENIRWVTPKENSRNKSNNHTVEIDGEIKTLSEWAEIHGITYQLIADRIRQGWRGKSLLQPPRKYEMLDDGFAWLWSNIRARCTNLNNPRYKDYGAKGIKFHEPWLNDEELFKKELMEEIGSRPTPNHQLDRIDNNQSYVPGNLRWATREENSSNKSNNRFVTINGETKTLTAWASKIKISPTLLESRLAADWEDEDLILPAQYQKAAPHLVEEIRAKYAAGAKLVDLAKEYTMINQGTIIRILKRRGAYSD